MIGGFSRNGLDVLALDYFSELLFEGFTPNECTLASALKSSAGLRSHFWGSLIHGVGEKSKFSEHLLVKIALIEMYMKCGKAEESCSIFDTMIERNTVSYNSMIFGLGQNGYFDKAVRLSSSLQFINLHFEGPPAAKLCIVLLPLLCAALIVISRVDDYWQHWQDVFAGGSLVNTGRNFFGMFKLLIVDIPSICSLGQGFVSVHCEKMAKTRDRTEDFKDAVHTLVVSSGYTEEQIDILKNRIYDKEKHENATRWLPMLSDGSHADEVAHKHGVEGEKCFKGSLAYQEGKMDFDSLSHWLVEVIPLRAFRSYCGT
ncbi:hypothetical protein IEQ34_011630 [Dendrobium chrysotoxum]|uniref:Pentatricopeptide repeat-containing protein n=1 Tax=Dendrobium chrysotoxum TaxID=161865 RepID=A0AAV7GQC7_DENCH|nr:hypothetical protein IEQ34_011630 [Dendrobium chrysotoxum]